MGIWFSQLKTDEMKDMTGKYRFEKDQLQTQMFYKEPMNKKSMHVLKYGIL